MRKPTKYHGERRQAKCKYYKDERIKELKEHPYGDPNDKNIPEYDRMSKELKMLIEEYGEANYYENFFINHYHFCLLDIICRYDKGLRNKTCNDIGPVNEYGDKDCDFCKYGCYAVLDGNNELVYASSNRRMFDL